MLLCLGRGGRLVYLLICFDSQSNASMLNEISLALHGNLKLSQVLDRACLSAVEELEVVNWFLWPVVAHNCNLHVDNGFFCFQACNRWSARAIRSFALGEQEARKLKYPDTGSEALLLGILVEGTSHASKFLRANGITFFKVREEIVNLLGKSVDTYICPEHPPLTEQAQQALDWAVDQKLKSGESGEITVTCLLLGLWAQKDSAAHQVMESLGFNDEKAKELSKYMDKDIVLSHK